MANNIDFNLETPKKTTNEDNKTNPDKSFISFPSPINNEVLSDIKDSEELIKIKTDVSPVYNIKYIDSSIVSANEFEFNKTFSRENNFDNSYRKQCSIDKNGFNLKHVSDTIFDKMLNISSKYTQDFKSSCCESIERYSEIILRTNKRKGNLSEDEQENLKKIIEKSKSKDFSNEAFFSEEDIQLLKNITDKTPVYRQPDINNLIVNIEKLQKGENIITDKYNRAVDKVKSSIEVLKNEINNIPQDLQNGFTRVLGGLIHEYEKALQSGNEVRIAMYSTLIEKIIHDVKHGKSGLEVSKNIDEYRNILNKFKNPSIPDSEKIDIVKQYIGTDRYNLVEQYVESKIDENYEERTETHNDNEFSQSSVFTESNSYRLNKNVLIVSKIFTSLGGVIDHRGNFIEPQPIVNEQHFKQLANTSSQQIQIVFERVPSFKEALYEFDSANKILIETQKVIGEIIENLEINKYEPNINSKIEKEVNEIINKIIEQAEELESNLNLEFDEKITDISELLEKFRDIIVKLDKDIREHLRKGLENMLITKKHTAYMQDMELRWKSIDKVREEINFLFDELKYVKL